MQALPHMSRQYQVGQLLGELLAEGEVMTDCRLQTAEGIKKIDIVWCGPGRGDSRELVLERAPEICVDVLSECEEVEMASSVEMAQKLEFEQTAIIAEKMAHQRALYFEAGAQEVWLCRLNGEMGFFGPAGALEHSALCPQFPQKPEIKMIKAEERMEYLLRRIQERIPDLEALQLEFREHWGEEDLVYRFYHQSYKVFRLQDLTRQGYALIEKIAGGPAYKLNSWYCEIVKEGVEREFTESTNAEWLAQTRPILEAFWHTKYFVEMMLTYGRQLETAPRLLPSGWASVLCLYGLR